MGCHHRRVAARGGVEGDARLGGADVGVDLLLAPTGDDEAAAADVQVPQRPAGPGRPYLQVGQDHLLGVLGGVEGVEQDAVAQLAGDLEHPGIDGGEVELDSGLRQRAGIEGRRHQVHGVVPGADVELFARLPAAPDEAQGRQVLPHTGGGRRPLHVETPDDVSPDLAAQAESEAAIGEPLQVPRHVGGVHGAAGEGQGDGGPELHPPGVLRREHQREEGVLGGFARGEEIVPQGLGLSRGFGDLRQGRSRLGAYSHVRASRAIDCDNRAGAGTFYQRIRASAPAR